MRQRYGILQKLRLSTGLLACLGFMLLALSVLPGLSSPGKGDSKRGKQIFQDIGCAICHTDGGNNLNPERPLKGPLFLKRYPPGDDSGIAKVIRSGNQKKGMPDFGKDKLGDKDLLDLMAYIRSLSPGKKK